LPLPASAEGAFQQAIYFGHPKDIRVLLLVYISEGVLKGARRKTGLGAGGRQRKIRLYCKAEVLRFVWDPHPNLKLTVIYPKISEEGLYNTSATGKRQIVQFPDPITLRHSGPPRYRLHDSGELYLT